MARLADLDPFSFPAPKRELRGSLIEASDGTSAAPTANLPRRERGAVIASLQAAVADPATASPSAMHRLASLYLDDHDYAGAIALLEGVVTRVPTDEGAWINLGLAYRGAERYDDAQRAYQRAIEIQPNHVDPYFNLAVLVGDSRQQYADAKAYLHKYIDLGGSEAELATAYLSAYDRAIAKAERQAKALAEKREREEKAAAEGTAANGKERKKGK